MSDRFLMLHSEFEADRPDEVDAARAVENNRRARYIRAEGSEEGYQPRREFPCHGALRVWEETDTGFLLLRCDRCYFETALRVSHAERKEATF